MSGTPRDVSGTNADDYRTTAGVSGTPRDVSGTNADDYRTTAGVSGTVILD
ncbi:MAG: hypothetical protein HY063_09735 [Bacteroidetes bacterium]|nr:hypothetical protein [Bacteroidota bacterium]